MKAILKELLDRNQKQQLKRLSNKPFVIGRPKIFCIAIQRSGTTSVGTFLNDHGIRTAGFSDSRFYNWDYNWKIGNFERIFKCRGFKSFQGFQDSPWWNSDFYKVLFHRFPNSKFIILKRNPDEWFKSMIRHSNGMNPGNTYTHCKIYGRMSDFFELNKNREIDFSIEGHTTDNLLELNSRKESYINYYKNYYTEIECFFSQMDNSRKITIDLEDEGKWEKLGHYLGIKVEDGYEAHSNRSIIN